MGDGTSKALCPVPVSIRILSGPERPGVGGEEDFLGGRSNADQNKRAGQA